MTSEATVTDPPSDGQAQAPRRSFGRSIGAVGVGTVVGILLLLEERLIVRKGVSIWLDDAITGAPRTGIESIRRRVKPRRSFRGGVLRD